MKHELYLITYILAIDSTRCSNPNLLVNEIVEFPANLIGDWVDSFDLVNS